MLLITRCARVASTTARAASTHGRALYTDESVKATVPMLNNLIASLDESKPPVGTDYPAPNFSSTRHNKNDLDRVVELYRPNVKRYRLYCQSTRNNTITTLMDNEFHPVATFTGGSCGFKKVNRSSYEAGYQCAVRVFREVEAAARKESFELHLYFKGFGQGRDAMHKALLTSEGDGVRPLIQSVTDRTPIKIGGTRAKKARRL